MPWADLAFALFWFLLVYLALAIPSPFGRWPWLAGAILWADEAQAAGRVVGAYLRQWI